MSAKVELADHQEQMVTGAAERASSGDGDLWCAAEATVAALQQLRDLGADALALKEVVRFEIEGRPAVAVALRASIAGQKRKLFGLSQEDEDRGRTAARAVLSATNRLVGQG